MSPQKNIASPEKSQRQQALKQWLSELFSSGNITLIPLTGDAGFRCYYRFVYQNQSYIAVDAPDEYCNNLGFVEINKALAANNINVPSIVAYQAGSFFCLSDLGENLLSDVLTLENMASYYQQAISDLTKIAVTPEPKQYCLPNYDRDFVLTELAIFSDWLIIEHLQLSLTVDEKKALSACFELLADNVSAQPQVLMHRDYHSRNIMVLNHNTDKSSFAYIDFQDAVKGPVTYDLVSLLRDCYIRWPQQCIEPLIEHYYGVMKAELKLSISYDTWVKWFDLMGIQRHIKAAGIFARLYHRDNKPGYLKDIPLTLSYIADIAAKYPSLVFLSELVNNKVIPALEQQGNVKR